MSTGTTGDTGTGTVVDDPCDPGFPESAVSPSPATVEWYAFGQQEELGAEIVVADLDGDGDDEILVSGPADNFVYPYPPIALPTVAGAYFIDGSASGGTIDRRAPTQFVVDHRISVTRYGYGEALAVVPTAGVPTIFVAGGGDDADGNMGYFYPASVRGEIVRADAAGTLWREQGHESGNDYLEAVGSADATGDGQPDLVVTGRNGINPPTTNSGALYIFDHVPEGRMHVDEAVSVLVGDVNERAGDSLAVADLDGDGVDEILSGGSQGSAGPGLVRVVSDPAPGTTSTTDHPKLSGQLGGENTGTWSVAGGDLDGDGFGDVVTGDPWLSCGAGRAFLVHGPVVSDRALDDAETTIEPLGRDDALGHGMAIGDFDGDGQADWAVGMPRSGSAALAHAGRVAVFLGPIPAGSLDETDAAAVWSGHGPGDGFGTVLATGDVDGDGRSDLVVGAPSDAEHGFVLAGGVHLLIGAGL